MVKKFFSFINSRIFTLATFFTIQLLIFLGLSYEFQKSFLWLYFLSHFINIALAVFIINTRSNPAYKITWLLLIFVFPGFGAMIYIFFGENWPLKKIRVQMCEVVLYFKKSFRNHEKMKHKIQDKDAYFQSYYIEKYAHFPVFDDSDAKYLKEGLDFYDCLISELKKAKKFIFLEFFIIEEGLMWNSILDILEEKVKEGVDVRLIYDDIGCISKLPRRYYRKLREKGIKVHVFNPVKLFMMPSHNNRDHRKIAVIDGKAGFTGGINLADEYINHIEKFGYWKDTGVLIKGKAVWGLTVMFLSMWNYYSEEDESIFKFFPEVDDKFNNTIGYVQPFGDSPLDGETVGETAYLNIISKAKDYVYITTPYLILSNEVLSALCNSAKGGVDVRIITPHIPDKKLIHMVTRSYYEVLIESGVKIYEFTPGFIHSKSFVSDDKFAIVGSINMDFRSLYLHFESAIWFYNMNLIKDIKLDFINTQNKSQEISLKEVQDVLLAKKILQSVLRVFAPVM